MGPSRKSLATATLLSFCLSGCGDPVGDFFKGENNATAKNLEAPPPDGLDQSDLSGGARVGAKILSLASGPDVCFREIGKQFGADVKVSEVTSFFSAGEKIDGRSSAPRGQMTSCTVSYQSPSDPRKLLSARFDPNTGSFDTPTPVEITVMGGNAADFRLADYVVPLSRIQPAALSELMNAQKNRLQPVYSDYAWSGVRLSSPSAFSRTHTLRLDLDGRLAANDIKESGYASVSLDGKRITADYLLP